MARCPLGAEAAGSFYGDLPRRWTYGRCAHCALVFREGTLTESQERHRYEQHKNHPGQAGYRDFLAPMVEEISRRCAPGGEGLDYGCGPGPVLALLLGERGMRVALHAPHFAPDPAALEREYDFVTCTEAEHFRQPALDFAVGALPAAAAGWGS